jgi:SHAQKYF class myb-like DNA-binding protein
MLLINISLTGVPWTEEEHRRFLVGLQKLGKGDWRGISRNFVVSRTPTQVASHAQKYFIRQSNMSRRKRRSSLFDMVPDEVTCLILSPVIMRKLVQIALVLYM